MIAKKKICKECSTEQYIWARGMCKQCAVKNPKEKSKLKEPVKKELFKPTGELVLFKTIWETRPHVCAVCKCKLHEFSVWFFSHILSKAAFGKFRLYEKNIVLKCKQCHHDWEVLPNDKLLAENSNWKPIIELHDALIKEYYESKS